MKYVLRNGYYCSDDYLTKVLELRGLMTTQIENFIKPDYTNLISTYQLDNIERGVALLLSHINKKSNILLIVDSDIDGYTSSAMLWNYLKQAYPDINLYYTLHSSKQHGLEDKIDEIVEEDFYHLVICPDSSSNDYDYHKRLAAEGIDCLVIDHHEAETYSENAVVINNQLSEHYPNKALSGAGVVYKFLCALDNVLGKDYANNYIDLAATGLVGDMMEVGTLENRYIIDKGLHSIKNLCLEELVKKQSFSIKEPDDMSTTDVAFYIVPLVNALIRVGKEEEKELLFKAFIQGDEVVPKISRNKVVPGEYETIAQQNARNCVNARSRQNRAVDKAIEAIEIEILKNGLDENKILLVEIGDSTIDTALTGLLAMKVMAKYRRPVLLGRLNDEGFVKGSLRGLGKGDLPDLKLFLTHSGFFEYCEG